MGVSYSSVHQWVVNYKEKCTKFWLPLVWPLQPMLKLNQATWDMAMVMDTLSEVSALVLVFTLLDPSMSPDLPRVLVRGALMLMLSQDITHRTTGHPLSLPTVTPPAMDAVVNVVLSQDILVLGTDMDMASEVSAEVLVSTLLGQFMSLDQPKVLVSAVLSQAILVMVLPLMSMLLEVSALE